MMEEIARAAELIRLSKKSVVFSGAGISTPSGIPDFRSEHTGLWTNNDPMQVASLTFFMSSPRKFYEWFKPLAIKIKEAKPNTAHCCVSNLEQKGYIKAVITQNIDGLHQQAGSKDVAELHGSLTQMICLSCQTQEPISSYMDDFINSNILPCCSRCGSVLKPDITLYEEPLPLNIWLQAESLSRNADLMLIIGSSLEVYPANQLPIFTLETGGRLIIINFTPTSLDPKADVILHGDAAEILPQLLALIPLKK
jgi:NAD-dependent deacetylase